mgnify:CR=1 FL=1
MKVAICTLGCKVNQYETQALEQELLHRGHTLVDFEETADAYVVNTCSVTAVSDKKSRQMLRQAQRRNPSAVIAACGCYAQTHPEDVKKLGLDVIAGTNDRAKFIDLLERAAQDKTPIVDVDDVWERRDFEVLPAGGMVNRTRAMLKVEDGCVNFCTYCLIPYARGRVRSLPMDEAAKQVKALREEGYREIVVTGIEISSYGLDFKDGTSLIDLLELIAREGGDMRIRLGSLEPRTITEEFCKRASKLPYLCPHFHLSMQSGCDATLKRMNRKYDTARYMESCDLLRQYFDDPAITTDLITGFPEETEEEFAQTLDFIARVGVVRRRSDLRTLRTRLLDDGDGQCRTLNGVGARTQLIEEDQAVLVRLVQDLHDVFHMRRKGRQTLLDALLVADVGQHRGKDAHGAAVVAGDMQAALHHQAEEAERL